MERDGVLAHGMSYFLNESFMIRGDEYYMAICNKTGAIAIYNEVKNLFFSPFADGPVNFHTNPDGSMNVQNISKFGRSFSILRIPYSFKLLIQELQTMNIQMRLITDENIDQMLSLSYSNNINELLQNTVSQQDETFTDFYFKRSIMQIRNDIKTALTRGRETKPSNFGEMQNIIDDGDSNSEEADLSNLPNIPIDINPPQEDKSDSTIPYAPGSPAYQSSDSQTNQPNTSSPFVPDMETELANTPLLIKKPAQNMPMTPSISPPRTPSISPPRTPSISPPSTTESEENKTILEVEEEKKEGEENNKNEGSQGSNEENNNNNSNETKKINL
jgi:DNA-directed RNA polymerase II subunit RPB2